jgi:hypothetical protein
MVHHIHGVVFGKVKRGARTILYFWKFELLEKRRPVTFPGNEVLLAFCVFF